MALTADWNGLEDLAADDGVHELVVAPLPPALARRAGVPWARTTVAAARCYAHEAPPLPDEPRGLVAPYTRSNFYRLLRRSLRPLVRCLTRAGHRALLSVNGGLPERPLALAAGMGGPGRNGLLLTPDHGSLVVLGLVLTDAPPPAAAVLRLGGTEGAPCTGCGACVAACPTGALDEGRLDRDRCIQALSAEPVDLPPAVARAWGPRLYGCSSCQDVCPVNAGVTVPGPLPAVGLVGAALPLVPFLHDRPDEVALLVRDNQLGASWVSPRALRRNAALALRHGSWAGRGSLLRELAAAEPDPLVRRVLDEDA